MKNLGEHFLDPTTTIKAGTLGKNGKTKDWEGGPIPEMHAFNPNTENDVFFADNGDQDSTFHTGMNLNEGQIDDLEDNDNIL